MNNRTITGPQQLTNPKKTKNRHTCALQCYVCAWRWASFWRGATVVAICKVLAC